MNKLLTISVLLLSVSLYGADKTRTTIRGAIYSNTGLEGFGKGGLEIAVYDYSDQDKTFDVKAIKNQVEFRLLQSGIKENKRLTLAGMISSSQLYIDAQPIPGEVGYSVSIKARRFMTYEANGKTYARRVAAWEDGGVCGKRQLRKLINQLMDDFLLAYLKANPKKKEKE